MKRILLFILFIMGVSSFFFAQAAESDEEIDPGFTYQDGDSVLRVGGAFSWQAAMGDLNDFVSNYLGGGMEAEYDLPLLPVMKPGFSVKVRGNSGFLKDDILSYLWNLQLAPGIYARFEFFNNQVVIQPGLNYGVQLNFPKANSKYNNKLDKVYADQMLEGSLSLRFSPANLLNGKIELGVTPFYVFGPEKNSSAHYAGAELLILYKL